MALRFNEFQIAVTKDFKRPELQRTDPKLVDHIEAFIGTQLATLATLAETVGTDLDFCAQKQLETLEKIGVVS